MFCVYEDLYCVLYINNGADEMWGKIISPNKNAFFYMFSQLISFISGGSAVVGLLSYDYVVEILP